MEDLLRATAVAEARHFWFRGLRAFITPLVRHATAGKVRPDILDCGCGTGANLKLLGRFGRAFGLDLAAVGLQIGREAGRKAMARASVTAIPFPSESFDVVTSLDVLYSLDEREERAAVSEMYRVLRRGGFLIVNVAAMPGLIGDHSVLARERRRYTRRALQTLLEDGGFKVVRLTYTNASLFLPLAGVRAYQRWRGLSEEGEAHREITVPAAPINAAMSGLLLLESLWLRRFDEPFGSSLLCLAKKSRDLDRPKQ